MINNASQDKTILLEVLHEQYENENDKSCNLHLVENNEKWKLYIKSR